MTLRRSRDDCEVGVMGENKKKYLLCLYVPSTFALYRTVWTMCFLIDDGIEGLDDFISAMQLVRCQRRTFSEA